MKNEQIILQPRTAFRTRTLLTGGRCSEFKFFSLKFIKGPEMIVEVGCR